MFLVACSIFLSFPLNGGYFAAFLSVVSSFHILLCLMVSLVLYAHAHTVTRSTFTLFHPAFIQYCFCFNFEKYTILFLLFCIVLLPFCFLIFSIFTRQDCKWKLWRSFVHQLFAITYYVSLISDKTFPSPSPYHIFFKNKNKDEKEKRNT